MEDKLLGNQIIEGQVVKKKKNDGRSINEESSGRRSISEKLYYEGATISKLSNCISSIETIITSDSKSKNTTENGDNVQQIRSDETQQLLHSEVSRFGPNFVIILSH